jgi:tetratricopeptide (TPR) repeat protein
MVRWWRVVPMAAMAAMSVGEAAPAEASGPWTNCLGGPGISREQQIADCSAGIRSGGPAKAQLAAAYYNRAHAFAEMGRWTRALADFDQAIRLRPKYPEAFLGRGEAFGEKNKWRHAVRDYDQAIRLKPDFADAYEDRAIAYDILHDYDRAIADFDQALRLRPSDASLYYLRGSTKLAKGDAGGHDDIAHAKELSPNLPTGAPQP